MKNMVSRVLAVLLIVVSVSVAVLWEFYFDDRINTLPVLQAVGTLPRGHKISRADLVLVRARSNMVPEGAVSDMTAVLGYETVVPVKKGMVVVSDFFDSPAIVPDENQMISPIPNQWIFSLPGSLRRKDVVSVYGFPASNAPPAEPITYEPLLKDITVAFAKDSSNQEVKPSDDRFQRIDATGNISQLELILTPEQFKILEAKALSGYKFVFTYR